MRGRWRFITLTFIIILLSLFPQSQQSATAQDEGPECPPGFFWDRLSGVGCVQESCLSIPNAKYSYTSSCICVEGYKSCTTPVDHAGLACEPFCPAAALVACVPPDQPCPGAGIDNGSGADAAGDGQTDPLEDFFSGAAEDSTREEELDALFRDLENFLAGENTADPTLGRAAAGAASVTALLTAWVISQLLAGTDHRNIIQAISRWRQKPKTAEAPAEKVDKAPAETKKEPEQAKTKSPPDESRPAETVKEETPPKDDAVPDLPTLKRLRTQEKTEAQQRIDFLKRLQVLLDEEYRRIFADWEVARRCAPVDGVIDIADIWLGLRGKLGTTTVRGAYGKDLLKQAIKGAFRKLVRYRVDGTFEISPKAIAEGAHSGLGVNPYHPGGALKQLLQNLVSGQGVEGFGASQKEWFKTYGKEISKYYGTGESVVSLVGNTMKDMNTTEGLRNQLSEIRTLFNKVTSDLETAQTDFEIADSSVKAIDQDIQELKENFPNRFKGL